MSLTATRTHVRYPETWDVLVEALREIVYVRDAPPTRGWGEDDPPETEVLFNSERFRLVANRSLSYAVLYIFTLNPNTYDPRRMRHTRHEFVVPVATYHREGWRRWVFDRIASIEHHETCESFQVIDPEACIHCGAHDDADGDHTCTCPNRDGECAEHTGPWTYRPYAPHHGNGWDPYTFWPGHDIAEKAKAPGVD